MGARTQPVGTEESSMIRHSWFGVVAPTTGGLPAWRQRAAPAPALAYVAAQRPRKVAPKYQE